MPTLLTLPYSPWSEKARLALAHHGVRYERVVHEPVIGEVAWRLRTGQLTRKATVPVLLDGRTKLFDSYAIAEHADRIGSGSKLFPEAQRDAIRRWNDASERALASGRRRSFVRTLADDEALEDNLKSLAPEGMRKKLLPVARNGLAFMQAKYGAKDVDPAALERELDALRAALAGRLNLLGELTYADMAMAVVLQMVEPVADVHLRISAPVRRTFRDPELARRYADLVEWRDAFYARYAKPS